MGAIAPSKSPKTKQRRDGAGFSVYAKGGPIQRKIAVPQKRSAP